MVEIERVINNPLTFNFDSRVCLSEDEQKESISLNPGAINGRINYGFTTIITREEGQVEETYPTQERIDAFGFQDGLFYVYEEGKRIPWIFDQQANLIQRAVFLEASDKDVEFLHEKYGASKSDIPSINGEEPAKGLK